VGFERILVASDFSEHSSWALDRGIALARGFGGRIDVVHAWPVPGPYDVALPDEVMASIRDSAARRLAQLLERVRAAGVEGDVHLVQDQAPQAIAMLAEELDADCIVMGTRGVTGLKHVLLGSNAERTLRVAPCPVLSVGQAPPADAAERPRKLLVPTDFSPTAQQALELAQGLMRETGDGQITLLHVHAAPVAVDSYMDATPRPVAGLPGRLLEELDGLAAPLRNAGLAVSARLLHGYAPELIVGLARDEQADWIVMGTHGRTGLPHVVLGSVAERVVRSAPCPTLTVKE
jgi:nucleotide-binding universal stress UspA family protein